jgi:hypothetical protein
MKHIFLGRFLKTLVLLPVAAGSLTASGASAATNPLPGKGLAEHDFFYAGEAKEENMYIVKAGHIAWSYSHPGRVKSAMPFCCPTETCSFAHQYAITEVTADKKVVWNYDAPANTEIHTAYPFGSNSVWFIQNGDPAKFMIVNKTNGKASTPADVFTPALVSLPAAGAQNRLLTMPAYFNGSGKRVMESRAYLPSAYGSN